LNIALGSAALAGFDWSIITQNLDMIILNVVLFFLFAIIGSLSFKKGRAMGASVSVIVAESFGFSQRLASVFTFIAQFYIAMQGLAVTAYGLLWIFGTDPIGYTAFTYLFEIAGLAMFVIGGLLVFFGWSRIFNAKDQKLVTDGLYNRVRHPQYLGILLACFGMIVYKFSPFSLMLFPVLVFIYYRLARKEEKVMEEKYGKEYFEYKSRVHMFLPFSLTRKAPTQLKPPTA